MNLKLNCYMNEMCHTKNIAWDRLEMQLLGGLSRFYAEAEGAVMAM